MSTTNKGVRRRARMLGFIRGYVERKGYPPSVREIARGSGLASLSTAVHHLKLLEAEGAIRRDPNVVRGVVVLP